MCFMSAPKAPAPAPPPQIKLPEPPPPAPMADIKQQSQAAPATTEGPAGMTDQLRRRMRSRLTIASAIGTPGLGA